MFQHSLEEAGRRLVQQRQQLKDAEDQFEAQYKTVRQSLDDHIEEVRTRAEEQFRKMRAEIPELQQSVPDDPQFGDTLRSDLEKTIEDVRAKIIENEAMVRRHLAEAELIIAERLTA